MIARSNHQETDKIKSIQEELKGLDSETQVNILYGATDILKLKEEYPEIIKLFAEIASLGQEELQSVISFVELINEISRLDDDEKEEYSLLQREVRKFLYQSRKDSQITLKEITEQVPSFKVICDLSDVDLEVREMIVEVVRFWEENNPKALGVCGRILMLCDLDKQVIKSSFQRI